MYGAEERDSLSQAEESSSPESLGQSEDGAADAHADPSGGDGSQPISDLPGLGKGELQSADEESARAEQAADASARAALPHESQSAARDGLAGHVAQETGAGRTSVVAEGVAGRVLEARLRRAEGLVDILAVSGSHGTVF
jgi:hypothetical protein